MLKQITFKNYKAFEGEEVLEIRPITLLIGKNSSGKSSLCKLLPLLANATSGSIDSPLLLNNGNISLGSRFEDLFHNNQMTGLALGLLFDNNISLSATYALSNGNLFIYEYSLGNGQELKTERYTSAEQSSAQHFKGLINDSTFEHLHISNNDVKFNVDYLGPMRIEANRTIAFEGYDKIEKVGIKGENTYKLLLNSFLKKDGLFHAVSEWMSQHLEGQKLTLSETAPGIFSLYIERRDVKVNIADVGFGLSQVLPIITQSFLKGENDIAVIEQPVLHLHPAAHANVAYRLAEASKTNNKKYIIESHSENFLLGLRKIVSAGNGHFGPEDVIIYFIDNDEETGSAYLRKITIDEKGNLSEWPTGVFSESFELLSDIMNNQK